LLGQGDQPCRTGLTRYCSSCIPYIFLTSYSAATIPAQHRHRPLVSKPYSPAQLLHVGRADLVDVMEHLGPHDTPRKNWRPA
jgi:hypothetical protein